MPVVFQNLRNTYILLYVYPCSSAMHINMSAGNSRIRLPLAMSPIGNYSCLNDNGKFTLIQHDNNDDNTRSHDIKSYQHQVIVFSFIQSTFFLLLDTWFFKASKSWGVIIMTITILWRKIVMILFQRNGY